MTIGTRIMTWFRGEFVGTDSAGNRYFRDKRHIAPVRGGGRPSREKRWVLYTGEVEASRVPPEWHAWLHHSMAEPPATNALKYPWQKEHLPNLTGTPEAYHPPGSVLVGGPRAPATADYEPWRPDQEEARP